MFIDEMWAWVSSDDDGEGILAASMVLAGQQMMMPLVGADRARVESFRGLASQIAALEHRRVKLIRFSTREVIETIN